MKALIIGVSGQDGAYLAKFLLKKGYDVYGSSRNATLNNFYKLSQLKIKKKINLLSINTNDYLNLKKNIELIRPNEIYNLGGLTSVSLSFENPLETMESIINATYNILEVIRSSKNKIRFYNSCSGDCFGNTGKVSADEKTKFNPCSPYGIAKTIAYNLVIQYRKIFGLHLSNGILFNHESPLRNENFVTKKIISSAYRISKGSNERLKLGNILICRDWGWSPEYVDAMWRMLQQSTGDDYVVATNKTTSLKKFIKKSFSYFGLNWKNYVDIDKNLIRPLDIKISRGNASKAKKILGWTSTKNIDQIINSMCSYQIGLNKK